MTDDLLTPALAEGVLTLTLGNGRAHALSLALIEALHGAIEAAQRDAAVRVVVIDGPGTIFCAGHDLKEIARHRADADGGAAYLGALFEACAAMMQAVATSRKPVIAQVAGIATAAGLQLVAACQMAFAGEAARFQLPGVARGGFCTTPAVAVSRAVSRKHLMELVLSAAEKSADWALGAGLVNEVVAEAELAEHTRDFARALAVRFSEVSADGLACTEAQRDLPLAEAYERATATMIGHFLDPEFSAREAASRFAAG